jgi:hypothetical protein
VTKERKAGKKRKKKVKGLYSDLLKAGMINLDDLQADWITRVREARKAKRLRKAMHGGGPQFEQQPLPDYQYIYHQPDGMEAKERERGAFEIRRRAGAARNTGVYGFHGEAPEPQLFMELEDRAKKPTMRQNDPRVLPERIFARMTGKQRKKRRKKWRKDRDLILRRIHSGMVSSDGLKT